MVVRDSRTHDSFLCVEDDLHRCAIALSIAQGFQPQADLRARHPLATEWTVDEDHLLLTLAEPGRDFLPHYHAARKENPKLFGRSNATEEELAERVQVLRSDPQHAYRFKLLSRDMRADDSAPPLASPSHARALSQDEPSHFQSLPRLPRNVNVLLIARDGATSTLQGNAQALSQRSPYLESLLAATGVKAKTELRTISLSERDPAFAGCPNTFDAFAESTIARYIDIAENPNLWAHRERAQEQLAALSSRQAASWLEYSATLQGARAAHVAALRELQRKEEEELAAALRRCHEEDARQLALLHQSHLRQQRDRIHRRYAAVVTDVEHFYEGEQGKMEELGARSAALERLPYEQQVAELEYHLREVLPDAALLPLLLAAEVLRDGDLRAVCLARIATRMTKYATRPELGCELLRSTTIEELLSRCTVPQLLAVQERRGFHFKGEWLRKELAYRQAQLTAAYRDWPLSRLIEAQEAESEPFPHLVEAELLTRGTPEAPEAVTLDVPKADPHALSLDPLRGIVTLLKPQRYATAVATAGRQSGGWGKWYWECTILQLDRATGCSISVGWDAPCTDTAGPHVPGLQEGATGFGVMWTSDGLLHHAGATEDVAVAFDRDDVIGIGLDQDRGQLTFYKNGQPVPLLKRRPDVPLPEAYALLPAVCLYAARPRPAPSVSVDFAGPFGGRLPRFFRVYGATDPTPNRPEAG